MGGKGSYKGFIKNLRFFFKYSFYCWYDSITDISHLPSLPSPITSPLPPPGLHSPIVHGSACKYRSSLVYLFSAPQPHIQVCPSVPRLSALGLILSVNSCCSLASTNKCDHVVFISLATLCDVSNSRWRFEKMLPLIAAERYVSAQTHDLLSHEDFVGKKHGALVTTGNSTWK